MNDEAAQLLAELFFKKETVSDWAVKCLEKGYDTKSLRILASMNNSYTASELDEYLNRSLKELSWDKIDEQDYLMRYAEILALAIIENTTNPISASKDIYQILINLDYPPKLHGWFDINEMIWHYENFPKNGTRDYWFRPKEQIVSEIRKASEELIEAKK